jgi:hypothetical protein
MNTNDIDAHLWLIVYAIHYSYLLDHVFMWAYDEHVATQLLKDDSLKTKCSKLVSTFWASWTPCYIYWVRYVLTLAISPHPQTLVKVAPKIDGVMKEFWEDW